MMGQSFNPNGPDMPRGFNLNLDKISNSKIDELKSKIKQLEAESQQWFEKYKRQTDWLVVILKSTQTRYKITHEMFDKLSSGGYNLQEYDSKIDNTKVIALEE